MIELAIPIADTPPAITPAPIAISAQTGEKTPVDIMMTSASAGGRNPAATAAAIRAITDLVKRFGIETIADAAHGQDQLRIRVVLFDVLAQPPHVNIAGARLDEGGA